jgi:hypothetical protein
MLQSQRQDNGTDLHQGKERKTRASEKGDDDNRREDQQDITPPDCAAPSMTTSFAADGKKMMMTTDAVNVCQEIAAGSNADASAASSPLCAGASAGSGSGSGSVSGSAGFALVALDGSDVQDWNPIRLPGPGMRYGCPLRSCKYNNGSDKDSTKSKPKANAQRHIACAHGVTFQRLNGKQWKATAPAVKRSETVVVVPPAEAKGADHKQEMGDAAQHPSVPKPQHTGFLRQRALIRTSTTTGLEVHIFPFDASPGSRTPKAAAEELKSSKCNSLTNPSSATVRAPSCCVPLLRVHLLNLLVVRSLDLP